MIIFKEGACPIKVLDTPDSESDLEKDMIDWNMQSGKNKKLSDDKSIELFGKTNQDRYEEYKHEFLKNKKDKPLFRFDGSSLLKEETLDLDALASDKLNTEFKIVRSKRYTANTTNIIIYPTTNREKLQQLKTDYDAMTLASKHKADDECLSIWGYDNEAIYNACLNAIDKLANMETNDPLQFVSDDISIDGYIDTVPDKDLEAQKLELLRQYSEPTKKYIFPISVSNTVNESTVDSSLLEMMSKPRNELLPLLLYKYDKMEDKTTNEAVYIEESILRLGWIPGIPYNALTQHRAALLESSKENKFDIVDVTDVDGSSTTPDKDDILYPVYIVLVEGISAFSHLTKAVTNGPFSHAGICIDETFKKVYSFNMAGSNGKFGGLSHEDAKAYPKDSKLGIFAIFVREKDYNTIQTLFEMYDKHEKDTTYSFLNIFALPFNKAIKMDFSMICSEFVDNILKVTNIDIVDKASPLVTPNDFYRASLKNKKIYKLYEGKVKNFLPKTISNRAKKIKKQYIKEMAMLETEFPIQFSDEGDLLINNIGKINYEQEIAKSKRLMKIYYKEDNREGLKYEIAKMYFIGNLISLDIERGKIKDKSYPARSHAYNLASTYLKLLLQKEKDFNFSEYYKSTPFNDATTTIKASTLKYSIKMLKDIILA